MNTFYAPTLANSLWSDLFDLSPRRTYREGARLPADVAKTAEGYLVTMDIPGVKKEDIKLSVNNHTLKVELTQGKRQEDKRSYLIKERADLFKAREFTFDQDLESSEISANLENGVLSIGVKISEPKTRLIEIAT